MISTLLLVAAVSKPISFAEAAAWLMPPTIVAAVATEHEIALGKAHELNPLMNTRGKRLLGQAIEVGVASFVVHKVSERNRKAGKWALGIFVGYKWIEGGWDVSVTLRK